MKNDKGLTIERDDRTVTYTQERSQENPALTGRTNININDINKRNAEQEKQEKKSSYTVAGIIILSIVFIIVVVYFLS